MPPDGLPGVEPLRVEDGEHDVPAAASRPHLGHPVLVVHTMSLSIVTPKLSTNLREVSQYPEKALIRASTLLHVESAY